MTERTYRSNRRKIARSGEATGAWLSEFDLEHGVCAVHAHCMKAGPDHRVPLATPALAIVTAMAPEDRDVFVFPRQGRALSVTAGNRDPLDFSKNFSRSMA
ncbi:hypothetical protein [Microvirga aerophila]|uniref:hypothetical protein n=1 Tax=Microvirga aerophila TaxID=670291 RepID=UPI0011BEFDBC|nr:hypothetical protein [Microvirga aerophila]